MKTIWSNKEGWKSWADSKKRRRLIDDIEDYVTKKAMDDEIEDNIQLLMQSNSLRKREGCRQLIRRSKMPIHYLRKVTKTIFYLLINVESVWRIHFWNWEDCKIRDWNKFEFWLNSRFFNILDVSLDVCCQVIRASMWDTSQSHTSAICDQTYITCVPRIRCFSRHWHHAWSNNDLKQLLARIIYT